MTDDRGIAERRRAARKTAIVLGLVAVGFFIVFIWVQGLRG